MTRSKTTPQRVLRLGLVLGDQLIDERQIAAGRAVTIGQSMDNTLAIALDCLPRRWVLFAPDGQLRLAPGMVADTDGDRGRVTIGEVTVLFQHVVAIEERPVVLPAELRRSLLGRVDRKLAAFLAGSIVLHAGVAVAAWMHDGPRTRTRLAMQTAAMIEPSMVDLVTFDPLPPTDDATPTPTPTPPSTPAPGAAIPAPQRRGGGGHRPSLPEMSPEEYIKAMRRGGGGAMADLPALSALPTEDVAVGPGAGSDRGVRVRDPVGPGGPRGPDLPDGPAIDGPGKPPERQVTPPPRGPDDPPPTDPDWIAKVLRKIETTYKPGLERCHKKLLATDPLATNLAVKLSFTVEADGSVGAHTAKSDEASVSRCISEQMAGWDLPPPPEGNDAHVSLKLALQGA